MERLPDIAEAAGTAEFRRYLVDLLVEICRIDTSIRSDVDSLRQAESQVFDVLQRELEACEFAASRAERRPIDPAIERHPFFTRLYYTQSPDRPEGLPVEQAYRGRCNLFFFVEGDGKRPGGVSQALNAHVDVVAPFFPPRVEGGQVIGRGACDDKGCVVSLLGALRLVGRFLKAKGLRLNRHLTAMFVIDEETGGNGSLSAALDRGLAGRYESLMVLESCGSRIHPGNRGAVWYRVEGSSQGANLFEAAAFIVEELEDAGQALRDESDHPLFPHRPVQTCHGIIGDYGRHPSCINAEVCFDVRFEGGRPQEARRRIDDVIASATDEYVGRYGDKTRTVDPSTGEPKVHHHHEVSQTGDGVRVRVLGASGHMGAIAENDCAITKMAALVRALVRRRSALEAAAGGKMRIFLHGWSDPHRLIMEGGQGFLPTHTMQDVQRRVRQAVRKGVGSYLRLAGARMGARDAVRVSFDKLHNEAFAGRADSQDMRNAIEAAKAVGLWKDEPVRGSDASCDARIFACGRPGLPVLTAGPGSLSLAHSDQERIDVDEMVRAAEFIAYFVLTQTATVE